MESFGIDIIVDGLTNSIRNRVTNEVFPTNVVPFDKADSEQIDETRWLFSWSDELSLTNRKVYKLVTVDNPEVVHGLISIEDKDDHIFIHLIESSSFNKGVNKVYLGVAGNLFAFACKHSFEKGFDGFVAFDSKSALIKHYQEHIGATHFKGQRMFIDTVNALKLIDKYFKE